MPRTCAICDSPHRREVDRRLKAGATQDDVRRWLAEEDLVLHRTAIGRHAKHALPTIVRAPGPRPESTDLLTLVRDRVVADVADGRLEPTVTHGLQAQAQLDARQARNVDQAILQRIVMAMTGNLPQIARVLSPEEEALETERQELESGYRKLLTPGD